MRERPSVWTRTRRFEGRIEGRIGFGFPPAARAYAADLAAAHGLDRAAVRAEARGILDRARTDGAVIAEEVAARVGRGAGCDPAVLLEEASAAVARWRAGAGR